MKPEAAAAAANPTARADAPAAAIMVTGTGTTMAATPAAIPLAAALRARRRARKRRLDGGSGEPLDDDARGTLDDRSAGPLDGADGVAVPPLRPVTWGIRVRIVVGYLVLMTLALAVTTIIARQVQSARTDREVTTELNQQVDELRRVAAGGPFDVRSLFDEFLGTNVAGDHEAFFTIPLRQGPLDAGFGDGDIGRSAGAPQEILENEELVRLWASADTLSGGTFETPVGPARVVTVPITRSPTPGRLAVADDPRGAEMAGGVLGVFVAVHFMESHHAELAELVRLLVLAGLAVLAVTTVLVWAMAGRIIAPVRELTQAAQAVTHSDLSARIPVGGTGELAELGTTFNEMVERLDRGFRAQRQFLDDIAHDLRTPLTIARGHLEMIGDDPTEREETVSIVLDELDRMGRSVTDLLVLAKAEQPHFLRLEAVDYGDFANDLMIRVSGLAMRAWVVDSAPRPGVLAGDADPQRLLEAMLNLVTNAVQHTADGTEIGIGVTSVSPNAVRMWVRDHGRGIDVNDADVLFQRFRRGQADAGRRDAGHHDGMGLGLSIVDAIARAHGGHATYQESAGGGSTFAIEIPLEPPDDGADSAQAGGADSDQLGPSPL